MLTNKVALITGSTSGIGLATAHVLAKQGIHVVLHGLLAKQEGQELAAQFAANYGIKACFDETDLRDEQAIAAMMDRLMTQMGSIDILVNNAGIQHTAPIEQFPAKKWHDILAINLSAAFYLTQHCLPMMRKQGWGRIINIASVHGMVASIHKAAYCSAKHGLIGLTKVTALECANDGITVNAICPGWVDTPLIRQQIDDIAAKQELSFQEARTELLTRKQPMASMIKPEHLAAFILFLCEQSAQGITGAVLPMDGAWTVA